MTSEQTILIGRDAAQVSSELALRFGNRHGYIAGATGTGKSVSLMLLAEGFARAGTPVFLADVKGDLAGLSQAAAAPGEKLQQRLAKLALGGWTPQANAVVFWDLAGVLGHPVRTSVSEMGPVLLARALELNDTQQGVLEVAFKLADDDDLLLVDLDDLRAVLTFLAEHAKEVSARYGLVAGSSIGAIQRALLRLEQQGGRQLLGEPALQLNDLLRQDLSGRGVINILAAEQLVLRPRLYSTFLLWLLSELFEQLPEVGDLAQPKLAFFFDEAHLLFDDCPPALRQRIEQVVRLIRSKGVGVYFCSQNPDDLPAEILGQMGNRIQHALRAYTPREQKAIKAAAESFPVNPALDVARTITELGVGEAVVSTLRDGGVPTPAQRVLVAPPTCRIGTISAEERAQVMARSPVGGKYDTAINPISAAEKLAGRATDAPAASGDNAATATAPTTAAGGWGGMLRDAVLGTRRRQGLLEATAKSAARTVGNKLGQQLLRGLLGSLTRGR